MLGLCHVSLGAGRWTSGTCFRGCERGGGWLAEEEERVEKRLGGFPIFGTQPCPRPGCSPACPPASVSLWFLHSSALMCNDVLLASKRVLRNRESLREKNSVYQILSLESISYLHCIIVRDLLYVIPECYSDFPYFLQFKSEFSNKEFMM